MTGYVEIKRLDHYGEYAVPTEATRNNEGITEVEFILLNCKHGGHKVWLTRKDI